MPKPISQIESLLFAVGRPVKLSELARALELSKSEIKKAVDELAEESKSRGIVVVQMDEKVQLMTSPDNAKLVGNFLNAELREKLTDAALETLAVILYKQPITRAEIEAIRGVNSQYILRQLAVRGMIEKATHPEDARRLVYTTTLDLMASLGIKKIKDLPDFEELTKNVSMPDVVVESTPSTQESFTQEKLDKSDELEHTVVDGQSE